jgi:hypothetical protein
MRNQSSVSCAITVLASALLVCLDLAGCAGNRELLEVPLAQSYFLPNPPPRVWKAVLLEASKPTRRILANDETAHLISWVSEIEPDDNLHRSLTDTEATAGHDDTIAITVVRVDNASGGTELTIRQTYCSARPFFGVSSSQGTYEREVLRAIRNSLIMEATGHVKD